MTRKLLLVLAAGLFGVALAGADDPNIGTWKLNEAKSKLSPGAPKNSTVVYAPDGDNVKVTVDGVDAAGQKTHSEWTGKFDRKPYPVTGDAIGDTRIYIRADPRTMTFTQTKDGKVTLTGKIVLAADGKTRTVTTRGTTADGHKFTATSVYDRQ